MAGDCTRTASCCERRQGLRFYGEDHEVLSAEIAAVVRGVGGGRLEQCAVLAEAPAVIAQRHERRPARQRGNGVTPVERQTRAEEATDGSRADDADLHVRALAP